MGIKEKPFTGIEDTRIPKGIRMRRSEEQVQAWLEAENTKWEVVAVCEDCDPPHPLASFEIEPHKLTHLKEAYARKIIGMLMAPKATPEVLAEVRTYLDSIESNSTDKRRPVSGSRRNRS